MSTPSPNETTRIISVGLDIGNSKCVVAISNNRVGCEEYSFHETPTVVHFARNHRLFGTAGANHATSNPTSTISHIKRLVELTVNSKSSRDELLRLPYRISSGADGSVSVNVRYLEENHEFTAVELLVMLLSHLRRVAEKAAGSAVSYCVIGVPSFFSSQQRRAYLDAALISGWNTLKLLDDGTAAALEYRSKWKGSADADAVVVAFTNIGHCNTQVTVVQFQGRTMRVIAEAYDQYLGGRDFDEALFQYLVGDLRELIGIDGRADVKVATKLRAACENLKRALSENKEAELRVDSLLRGIDVSWVITRDELEQMSSGLLNRIAVVFREALTKAMLPAGGLHSVELAGSGSRIPAISRKLTTLFGREVGRTVDPGNCVAFGCALQCQKMLQNNNNREKGLSRITSRFGTSAVELSPIGIRKNALLKAKDKEEKLAQQDKMVERARERRNSLEAYIRKSRNKVESEEITSGSERERISTKLAQMEDWLSVEGDDQPETVYEDKLSELRSLVSPIGRNGDGTQGQVIEGGQTGITASPIPGRSSRIYPGEASGRCSGTEPSDRISPGTDEMSSRNKIEANTSSARRLPLTGEQRQVSSPSRGNGSFVSRKNGTKSMCKKVCSKCKLCRGTDAISPSRK